MGCKFSPIQRFKRTHHRVWWFIPVILAFEKLRQEFAVRRSQPDLHSFRPVWLQSKTLSLDRRQNKQNNNTVSVLEVSGPACVTAGGLRGVAWAGFSPECSVWEGGRR